MAQNIFFLGSQFDYIYRKYVLLTDGYLRYLVGQRLKEKDTLL